MSDTSRTVELYENVDNLRALRGNKFVYHLAKSVIDSSGNQSYNVIFETRALAPRVTVTWNVEYALNWTDVEMKEGVVVTCGGEWKSCAPGEVYDLDEDGVWVPSTAPKRKDYLKVGKNHRRPHPGAFGIHIVVGVKTDGHFKPIWVDQTPLAVNSTAWYQPQEEVKWWLDNSAEVSVMYSGSATGEEKWNMSQSRLDGKHYVSTTYDYRNGNGTWKTLPDDAPDGSTLRAMVGGYSPPIERITNGDRSNDKELVALLLKLLRESGHLNHSSTDLAFYRTISFKATANWPATVAISVVVAGVALIAQGLINRGYQGTGLVKKSDHSYEFSFGPKKNANYTFFAGDDLKAAQNAWDGAVRADAKDGAWGSPVQEDGEL